MKQKKHPIKAIGPTKDEKYHVHVDNKIPSGMKKMMSKKKSK